VPAGGPAAQMLIGRTSRDHGHGAVAVSQAFLAAYRLILKGTGRLELIRSV